MAVALLAAAPGTGLGQALLSPAGAAGIVAVASVSTGLLLPSGRNSDARKMWRGVLQAGRARLPTGADRGAGRRAG